MNRANDTDNQRGQYENHREFIEACMSRPKDWKIFIKPLHNPPDGWDEQVNGTFPNDCVIYRAALPSANRSARNRSNDKHPCVILSRSTRTTFLRNIHELQHVVGYRCGTKGGSLDFCSRMAGSGESTVCLQYNQLFVYKCW